MVHIYDCVLSIAGMIIYLKMKSNFTGLYLSPSQEFATYGMQNMTVVISGLSNVYTHYITTYEEYQVKYNFFIIWVKYTLAKTVVSNASFLSRLNHVFER